MCGSDIGAILRYDMINGIKYQSILNPGNADSCTA